MALIAWSRAVSAQEVVYIDIDAKPIATEPPPAAPVEVAPAAQDGAKVVVAPIADTTGMFSVQADRALLDSALRAAIAEQPEAAYEVVELPPSLAPCDQACEVSRARLNEAPFLVVAEIQLFAGAYLTTIKIIRSKDAKTLRTLQTDAVTTPAMLLGAIKVTAIHAAEALAEFLTQKPPAAANAAPTQTNAGWAADRGWAEAGGRSGGGGVSASAVETYRSRRNAGVALFVLGIILESAGGGLLGAGMTMGEEGFLITGGIVAGVGTILFWTGLATWISNQIHMNKAERGLPVSRGLRLEGLSPIVASRERGAPGLSAAFSF